jgi:hypothetical protein
MRVIFGYVHNTRIEDIRFDIVDMEYPYNTIIGSRTLNAFEAILHPTYLCMKIPSNQHISEFKIFISMNSTYLFITDRCSGLMSSPLSTYTSQPHIPNI